MDVFCNKKNRVVSYIGFCLCVGVILFLVISLVSYNPTDNSWFYVSSEAGTIINQAGFWGAQLAATLYYLLGGAAFLVLAPLVCLGLIVMAGGTLRSDGERIIASLFLVVIGAIFLTIYHYDFSWSPYPGGVIGLLGAQNLLYYFDPIGRMLFLYVSLCASLILLLRWSFMFVAHYALQSIYYSYHFMKKYRVVSKVGNFTMSCVHTIFVRFPLACVHFMKSLINGEAFDQTDLLYPTDDEDLLCDAGEDEFILLSQDVQRKKYNYVVMRLHAISFGEGNVPINYCMLKLSSSPIRQKKCCSGAFKAHTKNIHNTIVRETKPAKPAIKKISQYALPRMDIFVAEKYHNDSTHIEAELQDRAHVLQDKLKRFGVNGHVTAIKRGPVVTLFEYQPDIDTKISKIIALEDDLAMALQAMSIRIIAPIPGRSVVGFEVSNTVRHDVLFSQITNQSAFTQFSGSLPLVLGKGTIGEVVIVDLARMPHLLIAGSTGSGKSVALNAILISLLCKLSPDELKLILIDPKRLEFAAFTDIAHLLFPIVTNAHQAAPVLRWVVQEMEERYEKMAEYGARNIDDFNVRFLQQAQDERNEKQNGQLPYVVVVIDELADLMITAGRDIEDLITRITQMARAAGIHMIVATQRPSVDVITGLIKANFPSRISFRVASRIDSRTILDSTGADRLLGRGDMLFMDASTSQLRRVHGAYVSDKEIEQVADHIRAQRKVEYLDVHQITAQQGQDMLPADDTLYKDVRQFLDEIDEISISLLQRKFRIGYNRSARIIDLLESQGLIMPQDGSKTRKVIR